MRRRCAHCSPGAYPCRNTRATSALRPRTPTAAAISRSRDCLPTGAGKYSFALELPAQAQAPYKFAELDWNPQGHVPAGVYAVPHMGVHWLDVRSPELQNLLGNPAGYQPFTKSFIYGSWNGAFTFVEPMVTRAYLLSQPDVTSPISMPVRDAQPGWHPTAYHLAYDAHAKEYRVALSGMTVHWLDRGRPGATRDLPGRP